MRDRFISGILSVLVMGCGSPTDSGVPAGAVALDLQSVPNEVASILSSAVKDRRRLHIQDNAAWSALWAEATANVQPSPAEPPMDFERESLVLASMGARPSGGYAIAIESAFAMDGQLHVTVLETSPSANCGTTDALTAPLHVVRVPRGSGTVVFVERRVTREC